MNKERLRRIKEVIVDKEGAIVTTNFRTGEEGREEFRKTWNRK